MEDEAPMFVGDDAAWQCYKEKEKVVYPEGKNPIMQLNEVYHGLKYAFLEQSGPVHNATFKVAVELEGATYEGVGNTKKNAKLQAAMNALEGLNTSGYLSKKTEELSQQRVERMEKRRQWLTERKDRLKKMVDQYRNRPKKNPPLPQNAIGKLNDRFKGLKYSLINQEGPLHNATFAISLSLCNQVFVGTGNSKKMAKLAASEKAINYLGVLQGENQKMDDQDDTTTTTATSSDPAAGTTDAAMDTTPISAVTTQAGGGTQAESSTMAHAPALPAQPTTTSQAPTSATGGAQEQATNQQPVSQRVTRSGAANLAAGRGGARGGRARGRGQQASPGTRGSRGGRVARGRGRGSGHGSNATNYQNPYQQYSLEDSFRSAGTEGGNQDYTTSQNWGYGDSSDQYNQSGTGDQGPYESYSTGGGSGGGNYSTGGDYITTDYSSTGGDYVQDSQQSYNKSYGAESW